MNDIIRFEKAKDNAAPTEVVYMTIKEFGELVHMKPYSVRSLTMIEDFPSILTAPSLTGDLKPAPFWRCFVPPPCQRCWWKLPLSTMISTPCF